MSAATIAAQRYYTKHRETVLAKQRAAYEANPEPKRQAARERYATLSETDFAVRRQQARDRYAKNPESYLARQRRQRKANPEKVVAANHRRRARVRDVFIEDVHPLVVLELDDGVCGICGKDVDPFDFHLAHVVPLALGGEHSYANVQVAHPSCNVRKGARPCE